MDDVTNQSIKIEVKKSANIYIKKVMKFNMLISWVFNCLVKSRVKMFKFTSYRHRIPVPAVLICYKLLLITS
jgi:hypothetical protein